MCRVDVAMALILPVLVYSWPCVCSSYFLRLIWSSGVMLKMYTMLWICWVFEKLLWRSSAYFSPLQSGKQFCSLAMIFNISHIYIYIYIYGPHCCVCFCIFYTRRLVSLFAFEVKYTTTCNTLELTLKGEFFAACPLCLYGSALKKCYVMCRA